MGIKDKNKNEYSVWEVGAAEDVGLPEYAGGDWSPLVNGRKRGFRRVFVEPESGRWDHKSKAAPREINVRGTGAPSPEPPSVDDDGASDISMLSGLRDLVLGEGSNLRKLVYGEHYGGGASVSVSRASSIKSSTGAQKFDHVASLKMTYSAFKDSESGKEGIPLQLLPEILEASRFIVPTEDELLDILRKLDQRFDPGEPIKWDQILHVAMHLERKEIKSSFSRSSPQFVWRSLQKSSMRRSDLEDIYPGMDPHVLSMMKELEQQRKKCEKEGNYVDARSTARRLNELKVVESNKRKTAMLERHVQERQRAERAYKAEIEERNKYWDQKITSFQKEVMEQAAKLKRQHTMKLDGFKTKMASKKPCKPQWSGELLNQRKVQEYLGKQGKYSEALRVKKTADRLEREEMEATIEAYQAEVGLKEQSLRTKQQSEMEVLLQKATKGRDHLRESRGKDLQRSHQRHKNIVRELKALHAHECFKFEQLYGKKINDYQTHLGGRSSSTTRGYSSLSLPRVAEDASVDGA